MSRVLEPEVIDDPDEVSVYADAAARAHLDAIDAAFVDHVMSLGITRGRALDVGTGPAQIPVKLLEKAPGLAIVGLDRGGPMLDQAGVVRESGGLAGRLELVHGEARRLPFPDGAFDLVMCNSVVHHLADPKPLLREMRRVMKPGGALVAGDLKRPAKLWMWPHILWHGRHYRGLMWRLFRDSVRASFSVAELEDVVRELGWSDARVIARTSSHLVVEIRPESPPVR